MIRDFEPEDIFDVEDIHKKSCDFPMPDIHSRVNVARKTIEIDGKVVGASYAHLTAEMVLILDKSLPPLTRAKIIRELFINLLKDLEQTDLEDVHVYVQDSQFARLLSNNFGFVPDDGTSLVKGLRVEYKNEQKQRESGEGLGQEFDDLGSDKNRPVN